MKSQFTNEVFVKRADTNLSVDKIQSMDDLNMFVLSSAESCIGKKKY